MRYICCMVLGTLVVVVIAWALRSPESVPLSLPEQTVPNRSTYVEEPTADKPIPNSIEEPTKERAGSSKPADRYEELLMEFKQAEGFREMRLAVEQLVEMPDKFKAQEMIFQAMASDQQPTTAAMAAAMLSTHWRQDPRLATAAHELFNEAETSAQRLLFWFGLASLAQGFGGFPEEFLDGFIDDLLEVYETVDDDVFRIHIARSPGVFNDIEHALRVVDFMETHRLTLVGNNPVDASARGIYSIVAERFTDPESWSQEDVKKVQARLLSLALSPKITGAGMNEIVNTLDYASFRNLALRIRNEMQTNDPKAIAVVEKYVRLHGLDQ